MFLLPLAFYGAIALTIWFVFFTEASTTLKIFAAGLFVASLLLRYTHFALAGFLLQIAIAIFILIYQKTRSR